MGLKGQYSWIQCMRQGGRKAISFTLTCTNIFQSETFDAAIIDGSGQLQPMVFRQQALPAKKSLRFDYDTVGWDWCQGDIFAILDRQGQMAQQWPLNLQVPAPGECRECHGTHKCGACNGTGMATDRRTHTISHCATCHGTGICQTCYVPMRQTVQDIGTPYGRTQGMTAGTQPNPDGARQRKIAAIRRQIEELQAKIAKCEKDEFIMQLRGTDITSHSVYSSQLGLKYKYQQQLIKQQYMLEQLEDMQS